MKCVKIICFFILFYLPIFGKAQTSLIKNDVINNMLFDAVQNDNLNQVSVLLNAGADPNAFYQEKHQTPLHWAAYYGFLDIAELLIVSGAHVNALSTDHYTPLHLAAQQGHFQVAQILLQNGAEKEIDNQDLFTPLHMASFYDHADIVSLLIDSGADIEAKSTDDATPLQLAAQNGALDAVNVLLQKGANINWVSTFRGNALHFAIHGNHANIVKVLLEHHIHPNEMNSSKATPFLWNGYIGNVEIAKLLLAFQANPQLKNIHGYNALHTAAMRGNVDLIRFFLKEKIYSGQEEDIKGLKPANYASFYGHSEALKVLLEANQGQNALKSNQQSLILCAMKGNHPQIVDLLVNHYKINIQEFHFTEIQLKDLGIHQEMIDFLKRKHYAFS